MKKTEIAHLSLNLTIVAHSLSSLSQDLPILTSNLPILAPNLPIFVSNLPILAPNLPILAPNLPTENGYRYLLLFHKDRKTERPTEIQMIKTRTDRGPIGGRTGPTEDRKSRGPHNTIMHKTYVCST